MTRWRHGKVWAAAARQALARWWSGARPRPEPEKAEGRSAMLLAQLSHDIRAPLTGIRMLMQGMAMDRSHGHLVDEVEQSVQYLLSLSDSHLRMLRAESREEGPASEAFDLAPLVLSALNLVKRRAQDKHLRLIVDWRSVDLCVRGNPVAVKQILINLLSNAIQYTPQGHIHVATQVGPATLEGDKLTLLVTDTGPGLKDPAAARAFEPFVRLHGADAVHPHGFGLGLSIVKSLAVMCGGCVSATDLPQGGLCVSVMLKVDWTRCVHTGGHQASLVRACWVLDACAPAGLSLAKDLQALGVRQARWVPELEFMQRVRDLLPGDLVLCDTSVRPDAAAWMARLLREHAGVGMVLLTDAPGLAEHLGLVHAPRLGAPARLLAHLPSGPQPMARLAAVAPRLPERHQGKRVLVVDDSQVNQVIVGDYLSMLGFQVLVADDGAEALDLLAGEVVDLVLTDLTMPLVDGSALLRIIRLRGLVMPVVALTGNAEPAMQLACLRDGMSAYLTKPLDFDQALHTLVGVLDGHAERPVSRPVGPGPGLSRPA